MIGQSKEFRKTAHSGLEDSVKTSWRNRNLHWAINDKGGFEHCRMEKASKAGSQEEQRNWCNTQTVQG